MQVMSAVKRVRHCTLACTHSPLTHTCIHVSHASNPNSHAGDERSEVSQALHFGLPPQPLDAHIHTQSHASNPNFLAGDERSEASQALHGGAPPRPLGHLSMSTVYCTGALFLFACIDEHSLLHRCTKFLFTYAALLILSCAFSFLNQAPD